MIRSPLLRRMRSCIRLWLTPAIGLLGPAPVCLAQSGAGLVLKTVPDVDPWTSAFKAIVVGAIALALTFFVLRQIRRRAGILPESGTAQTLPKLVHSRRISQKTVLLVVRWQDKTYLLAETGQSTQLLDCKQLLDSSLTGEVAP